VSSAAGLRSTNSRIREEGRLSGRVPRCSPRSAVKTFSEEVAFRAGALGTLVGVLARSHVLLLVAAYSGVAHYVAVPSGLPGVAMAGF
jgi:hypothetical protein